MSNGSTKRTGGSHKVRCTCQVRCTWGPVDRLMRQSTGRVAPAAVIKIVQQLGPLERRVRFERAYGSLDPLEGQYPTKLDSVFDLASVSKIFTLTAFLRLVTQGKVSVDTPVREVLPAFSGFHPIGGTEDPITKQPVAADEAFAGRMVDRDQITFYRLLTHTSGLAAWRGIFREGVDTAGLQPMEVPADVRAARIAAIYRYPFVYPPGERLVYSDLGLILLGEAIASLSGEPLDQAVRHLVLEPLGVADQAWYNPLACGVPGERIAPTEYDVWRSRRLRGEVHDENAAGLGGVAGHAGMFATADAVEPLGELYLNGGLYEGEQLVDADLVAESTREHVRKGATHRGLGWVLYPPACSDGTQSTAQRSPFGHTGYTGPWLWCDPGRDWAVVLLCNRVYYGRDPEGIARLRLLIYDAVGEAISGLAKPEEQK